MKPKFQHDCDKCQFLGHFVGFDVYICRNDRDARMSSLIARDGDEGHEYASNNVGMVLDMIKDDTHSINDGGVIMPMQKHIFTERGMESYQAWLLALSVNFLGNFLDNRQSDGKIVCVEKQLDELTKGKRNVESDSDS